MKPSIGRVVHYQSHGSADGTYPSVCRAAIVTEVENEETVSLAVLNPDGIFLKGDLKLDAGAATQGNLSCPKTGRHHEFPFRYCECGWIEGTKRGGTWHWPEREEETLVRQVADGLKSIDQAREELGREPWGLPETS